MALALRFQDARNSPSLSSSSSSSYSSSRSSISIRYDVFLSFRGEDTRKTFTAHLYKALKQAGIRTFRDDDEMDRGKLLKPELEKAIQNSAVSVIIFSKNYASSRWCLDEVLMILEERKKSSSKHEVVPVFYNVDPSDVRNQKGSFAEAFCEHYNQAEAETDDEIKKERLEKVKAWRAALREAADLTGMVLDGNEADFINKIVGMLKKKLKRNELDVAVFTVGIDDRIYGLHSWINNSSSNILVLYGIGGIGKTTTAKCIYNSIIHKFEVTCFLADIRETFDQSNGVIRMQSQLVSAILMTEKDEIIWNVHEGASKVKEAIMDRDVLIVLDDVSDKKQLEQLLGTSEFTAGSKIIITTRNKELLYSLKGHCQGFAIRELDENQSMELFSWHAFGQCHPREAYKDKAEVIVRHCGGLPLALKVLGSSLRGRDVQVWEDSLCKLEEIPNSDIQKRLKVSYESLQDDKDKDLFLHIACFFVRENKHDVIRILEQCGLYPTVGIDNLTHRCLLDIEENNLVMHELLQKMGKEIVRQESPLELGKRSRLWKNEDSFSVIKEKNGTRRITGLSLDMKMLFKDRSMEPPCSDIDDMGSSWNTNIFSRADGKNLVMSSDGPKTGELNIGAFESMDDLMLLRLNYARLSGSYQKLPKKLRWLCWHGFPSKSLPSELPLDMLVSLEISYSKLQRVWKGIKFLRSLKILNLSYSERLLETPDFRGLPCLEKLILKGCVSLVKVCESIKHLKELVWLDLQGCESLSIIPCLPTSLLTLLLSNLSNLDAVTQGKWWDSLPRHLVHLDIKNCNLTCESFPQDFSHLVALECLDISYNYFTALPQCVGSLPSIRDLKVRSCPLLQSILGLPHTLESLDACANDSLVEVSTVPNSITFFNYVGSGNLAAVHGYFKSAASKDVDRKIRRYIGLESISFMTRGLEVVSRADIYDGNGSLCRCRKDDPIEVWYEFGIFSISVPGEDLPDCYMFKTMGSQIAFKVPSVQGKPKVGALNVSFICRSDITLRYHWTSPQIHVYNRTKDLMWVYIPSLASFKIFGKEGDKMNFLWLSLWKCGNLLEAGDEVYISIGIVLTAIGEPAKNMKCDECCVNLVYEDMILEEDEVVKEMSPSKRTCQLSWTDKLLVEISDYVHRGKTYYFSSYTMGQNQHGENVLLDGKIEFVDWLGTKHRSSSRYFNGGLIQHIRFPDHE